MFTFRHMQERIGNLCVKQAFTNLWKSEEIIYSGKVFNGSMLPGFLVEDHGRVVGLITYERSNNKCRIISLNSFTSEKGIGTVLTEVSKKLRKRMGVTGFLLSQPMINCQHLNSIKKRICIKNDLS